MTIGIGKICQVLLFLKNNNKYKSKLTKLKNLNLELYFNDIEDIIFNLKSEFFDICPNAL
jgi:hypothetical protein